MTQELSKTLPSFLNVLKNADAKNHQLENQGQNNPNDSDVAMQKVKALRVKDIHPLDMGAVRSTVLACDEVGIDLKWVAVGLENHESYSAEVIDTVQPMRTLPQDRIGGVHEEDHQIIAYRIRTEEKLLTSEKSGDEEALVIFSETAVVSTMDTQSVTEEKVIDLFAFQQQQPNPNQLSSETQSQQPQDQNEALSEQQAAFNTFLKAV